MGDILKQTISYNIFLLQGPADKPDGFEIK
jgi:hypothetical protein